MPSWVKGALIWLLELGVKALGGKTTAEAYQEGFRAATALQEKAADDAQKRMDAVPESDAAGRLRDGTY
jgi:hypothetical protein